MSAPWLKFYPSDWRADPALRMCSIAARGLWMEMLCLMHEAVPYGSLRINGKPVTERQLALLAGLGADETVALLAELEASGVFSVEDGAIVSRRMQRDEAKADTDKQNGKRGGNPRLGVGVNPPVNGGDKAQIPEARYQKPERKEEPRERAFDAFWSEYPHKVGKADASKAFARAASRIDLETLMAGLRRYAAKTDDRPWCNPATWLNQDRWTDEPATAPPARASPSRVNPTLLAAQTLMDKLDAVTPSKIEGHHPPPRLVAFGQR